MQFTNAIVSNKFYIYFVLNLIIPMIFNFINKHNYHYRLYLCYIIFYLYFILVIWICLAKWQCSYFFVYDTFWKLKENYNSQNQGRCRSKCNFQSLRGIHVYPTTKRITIALWSHHRMCQISLRTLMCHVHKFYWIFLYALIFYYR